MSKIYLDMDGVLVDFNRGLLESYGVTNCIINYGTPWDKKTEEQKDVAKKVESAMNQPGFFENLPVMEGAIDLWKAAHFNGTPYILTALPLVSSSDTPIADQRVALEKRNWVDHVFGQLPDDHFIACLRSEKIQYAKGNILVDDLINNVNDWKKAGGDAVLFKNSKQAIWDMEVAYGI